MQERGTVAALSRGGGALARLAAYGLAVVAVVADRVITSEVQHHFHHPSHVWGPFGIALQYNSGLAFSLFSGRSTVLTVVLAIGVAVLALLMWRLRHAAPAVGAGLILGGGLGNLSERIVGTHHGRVADYITLTHWPTFNVADACISVGAVVLAVSLLFDRPVAARPAGEASAS